jgi:hypothetical protein
MITPNGGVFGRNPKFNTVTTQGGVTSTGGLNVTPNAVAPESNVTIGPSAGANLVADSVGNILLGSGAGDVLGASGRNVAIGTDALGAFSAGAASITNTTPGTGGTGAPTTYNNILLEKDSGVGEMTVYPTVNLRVSVAGAVDLITIVSPGSGATVASGIVLRAVTTPAGVPTNWRGTLATVGGNHIAIGNNALLLATPVVPLGSLFEPTSRIAIGAGALDAVTTGWSEIAIGENALGATTTGTNNIAIGNNAGAAGTDASACLFIGANAGRNASTSSLMAIGHNAGRGITSNAPNCCIVGSSALSNPSSTIAPSATVIGEFAFSQSTNVTGCTAVGNHAGSYRGATGTTTLAAATNSIFIGRQSRADDTGQTNQVVIGGIDAIGDGSNTTVLGTTATTQARVQGGTFLSTGANGQSTQLGQSTTLLTGLTGATVTATNLIPANCILLGVTARVTTAITGATTFDIGDGSTADRFGDDIAIALNTTANNCIAPALITAATNVVLTANGSNFTGGAVRLTAHFMTLVAPTS